MYVFISWHGTVKSVLNVTIVVLLRVLRFCIQANLGHEGGEGRVCAETLLEHDVCPRCRCCPVPDLKVSGPDMPSGDVDVKVSAPDMPSADVDASVSVPDVPSVDVKAPKKGIFGKLLHKKASKASVQVRYLIYALRCFYRYFEGARSCFNPRAGMGCPRIRTESPSHVFFLLFQVTYCIRLL